MARTTAGLGDLPLEPKEECDIVMKGGITSGVVYPLAVVELARKYRLRSIGGTSAGAIAAGLTAAAELRRRKGSLAGFEELARLPEFLQENLTSLFQPHPTTRPLFEVLLTWIGPGGVWGKTARSLATAIRSQLLAFVGGAVLGMLLFLLLVALPAAELRPVWAGLVLFLFILAGGWGAAVVACGIRGYRAIEKNAFGICPGMGNDAGRFALTPWLAATLDRIAGKQPGEKPLTFGDLWGSGGAKSRDIDLQVMTTNLTHGVPERLPFKSRMFFYDRDELRKFFPEDVVDWMERHPRESRTRSSDRDEKEPLVFPAGVRPLPEPEDLPVVVAVRMSLSFPVLLSAIPLYAVERIWDKNAEAWTARLSRCWFSDGGIGSNFPVHFFDQILPSRPTFGINLRPFAPGRERDEINQGRNVRFPSRPGQEVSPTFTHLQGLFSFVWRIIETMQNWVDNTQMRLPGYRDRVVHVHLTDDEGGMNLTMPPQLIEDLTERGKAAGRALVTDFKWDLHRWTRYHSAMNQLRDKLGRMDVVYRAGLRDYLEHREFSETPYGLEGNQAILLGLTDNLMRVAAELQEKGKAFSKQPPRPVPDLRIMPQR
jgi:predicted acylesterase/phospholipase RssA